MFFFEDLEEIKQEILFKYKDTLKNIGVDLLDREVVETIDCVSDNLENHIRAFICWHCFLQGKEQKIHYPNEAFKQALYEKWHPSYFRQEQVISKIQKIDYFRTIAFEVNFNRVDFFVDGRRIYMGNYLKILDMTEGQLIRAFRIRSKNQYSGFEHFEPKNKSLWTL